MNLKSLSFSEVNSSDYELSTEHVVSQTEQERFEIIVVV
jgi:hypothetical protein